MKWFFVRKTMNAFSICKALLPLRHPTPGKAQQTFYPHSAPQNLYFSLITSIADKSDSAKKLTSTSIAARIPKASAKNPVIAVKTTPPMPVADVMIPVAVAICLPAKGSIMVSTPG